jgi:hypothetical protein
MELDRAIQREVRSRQNIEDGADSDGPAEPPLESLDCGHYLRKKAPLTMQNEKHWTALSLADLLTGLEDMPLRRL